MFGTPLFVVGAASGGRGARPSGNACQTESGHRPLETHHCQRLIAQGPLGHEQVAIGALQHTLETLKTRVSVALGPAEQALAAQARRARQKLRLGGMGVVMRVRRRTLVIGVTLVVVVVIVVTREALVAALTVMRVIMRVVMCVAIRVVLRALRGARAGGGLNSRKVLLHLGPPE